MFDLVDRPLHWITVKWPGIAQGDDESADSVPTMHEVGLRVEILDRDEVQAVFPGAFGLETEAPPEAESFKRIVKEWRKVVAKGRPVPMNDDNVALMLKVPMFASAFTAAYLSAMGGVVEIREGNSPASPPGGRADGQKAGTKASSTATADASD